MNKYIQSVVDAVTSTIRNYNEKDIRYWIFFYWNELERKNNRYVCLDFDTYETIYNQIINFMSAA